VQTDLGASARDAQWIYGAFALVLSALLLVAAGHATWTQIRWSSYVAALEAEDGIVILDRGRGWRGHYVRGLRDPLAADPELMLAERGLRPQAVSSAWFAYHSEVPELVLARARQLLRPPEHVELRLENGTLSLAGQASEDWTDQARRWNS
jgi:OOP family OmpA-OmpF porin